jgi:ubiquinone biosynthesis protein UbiJ
MRNQGYFIPLFAGAVEVFSEAAINRILCMDPEIINRLAPLEGDLLKFEVERGPEFFLRVNRGKTTLMCEAAGYPDATVRIALHPVGEEPAQSRKISFFDNLIEDIEGNPNKVIEVRAFFSSFEPDLEEGLSQIIGDFLAHKVGQSIRYTKDWTKDIRSSIVHNLFEYLREERQLLSTRTQTERYCSEVRRLEIAAGVLESRLISLDCLKE